MSNYHRLKEVFQAVLELKGAEREAYLDVVCADDSNLRAEVEKMLAIHNEAETFLDSLPAGISSPLANQDQDESVEGRRIGHYRIIRELGRGGMGTVYLAERDDEYRKQVAIKLIKRGMDTDFVIRRFRHERQILANLNHPHIARLLDGGTTDDGLPYFVMEYIDGELITAYCDKRQLTIEGRLKLFRQVCAAVQYAHQNLVIHRDLKPSNILITSEGVPKLLDFGIAKLLNPENAETDATATAVRLMTPEYASPEQARGLSTTTASDVYSLGVVLYELLTGHRPYRVRNRLPHEMLKVICEDEPAKPSTVVSRIEENVTSEGTTLITPETVSFVREGQLEKLRRKLRGDLDNIVLKALRKEPERRYSSVEQFSEDLRRHLSGLPVMARDDTLSYRAGKFVKRHLVGVAVAAAMLIVIMSGVVAVLWQARVAQAERAKAVQRFNEVRALAHSFLFEFHDAIEKLPGSTPARAIVIKRALEYLDRLARESSGDLSLQRELATAYEKVGDIQGNFYQANLGDTAGALESYRRALAIRTNIAAAEPTKVDAQIDLAASHNKVGDVLLAAHDFKASRESYDRALRLIEPLIKQEPQQRCIREVLAATDESLAEIHWQTGADASGFETYRRALSLREALAREEPANRQSQRRLASALQTLSSRLIYTPAKAEALSLLHRALVIFESLAAAEPANAQAKRELASCYSQLGDELWATGDLSGEVENYHRALALREELSVADPANVQLRHDFGQGHGNYGYALAQNGDARGLEHCQKAISIFESLAASDPANTRAQRDVAAYSKWTGDSYALLAEHPKTPAQMRHEYWQQAQSWYQRSLALTHRMHEQGTLRADDAGSLEEIQAALAKCKTALR